MSEFNDRLASLCAREAAQLTGDQERAAAAIEALARCLALTTHPAQPEGEGHE